MIKEEQPLSFAEKWLPSLVAPEDHLVERLWVGLGSPL